MFLLFFGSLLIYIAISDTGPGPREQCGDHAVNMFLLIFGSLLIYIAISDTGPGPREQCGDHAHASAFLFLDDGSFGGVIKNLRDH